MIRLVAGVALIAFASLWVQIHGLIGEAGILPASTYLEQVGRSVEAPLLRAPTILWLGSGDLSLHLVCAGGVAAALAALAGIYQLPALVVVWALYLSLVVAGQDFLSFQWDVLLLETLVVAWLMAPAARRSRLTDPLPAATLGIWMMRLLAVKLMLLSGATKLLAFDETWWQLTALDHHYFTQPLPTWPSWWAHQLPSWFQRASVAVTLVVELGAPWLVFCGRRARLVAFLGLLGLQLLIAATGNYGFFNLLTAAVCVSFLDDRHLNRLLPLPATRRLGTVSDRRIWQQLRPRYGHALRVALASLVLVASVVVSLRELVRTVPHGALGPGRQRWVDWIDEEIVARSRPLLQLVAPLRSVNGYGLFRAMTTERPEIVIEVRAGAEAWHELSFRYKPGAVDRRPAIVAPHQPRLDWQMWFAALAPRSAGWLGSLSLRLLDGEPSVWALVDEGGVPEPLPDQLRLRLYDYTFTSRAERERTGAWWRRERIAELSDSLTAADIRRRIQ